MGAVLETHSQAALSGTGSNEKRAPADKRMAFIEVDKLLP